MKNGQIYITLHEISFGDLYVVNEYGNSQPLFHSFELKEVGEFLMTLPQEKIATMEVIVKI